MSDDSIALQFSYLTPYDIGKLSKIMVVKPYVLQCVVDHYTLARNQDDHSFQVCPIIEIPLVDMYKFPEDHYLWDTYNDLVSRFGQEVVDMYVPKDSSSIKKKIDDVILLAMDKVNKRDDLWIEFNQWNTVHTGCELLRAKSSASTMIYEAAQENYDIIDQDLSNQLCRIHIKKRR